MFNTKAIKATILFTAVCVFGWIANGVQTLANLDITNEVYTAAQTEQKIVELAPAPGDYAAVSNAAMNATAYTDDATNGIAHEIAQEFLPRSYAIDGETVTVGFDIGPGGYTFVPSSMWTQNAYIDQLWIVSDDTNGPLSKIGQYGGNFTNARTEMERYIEAATNRIAMAKLDGSAAYPAYNPTNSYTYEIVSYGGRLWRGLGGPNGVPGSEEGDGEWEEVYLKDLKQDSLPYPTNAIPYSAITNVPSIRPDMITDGTNTIYANMVVYRIDTPVWILDGSKIGLGVFELSPKGSWFSASFYPPDPQDDDIAVEVSIGEGSSWESEHLYDIYISVYRWYGNQWNGDSNGTIGQIAPDATMWEDDKWRASYVGKPIYNKLALTNDIPNVDFTTSNTLLVATIEATSPAPGNYGAVSNTAMNARSGIDLGVRGAPQGEGSWFLLSAESSETIPYSYDSRWESISGTITKNGNTYTLEKNNATRVFSLTEESFYTAFVEIPSTLSEEDSTNVLVRIIGYVDTIAQTSQIPAVPQGIVVTNAQGVAEANIGIFGSLAQGTNVTASGAYSHAEGDRTTASGKAAHAEGVSTRALGEASHSSGINTYATQRGTFSAGVNVNGTNSVSFVWSGYETSPWYGTHGVGTFNVNPRNGINGFYIGDVNLQTAIVSSMMNPAETNEVVNYYVDPYNSSDDVPEEAQYSNPVTNQVPTIRNAVEILVGQTITNRMDVFGGWSLPQYVSAMNKYIWDESSGKSYRKSVSGGSLVITEATNVNVTVIENIGALRALEGAVED